LAKKEDAPQRTIVLAHAVQPATSLECVVDAQANSSRTIEFNRFDFAGMTVHVQRDGTATNLAILNRGKRAGRSVDDRSEDRSAVGTDNA
jgi:hypothetical protein